MDAKTIQKYKKYSVAQLKKKATAVFNKYIRERDLNHNDTFECVSCLQVKPKRLMNAGHFFSGTIGILKYDEKNVHGQCIQCNFYKHGNLSEYRKNIVKRIGLCGLQELEQKANQNFKFDRFRLIEIIEEYKTKKVNNEK